MTPEPIVCTPRSLPPELRDLAAARACALNPVNRPPGGPLAALLGHAPVPEHLALLTTKYWGAAGVLLTVGFLDNPPQDLRARILAHMNAWGAYCNAGFVLSGTDPHVRIARTPGGGYWSYLGTDVLTIPADQPTMNLDSFTMATPESEFVRVVRHETGHTLGFPHEHVRREIVQRIDRAKALAYFLRTQGWTADETAQQVLTPLDEASVQGTPHADGTSIMCYQLPAAIMRDGKAVPGGLDIDQADREFAAKVYPKPVAPTPQALTLTLSAPAPAGTYTLSPRR